MGGYFFIVMMGCKTLVGIRGMYSRSRRNSEKKKQRNAPLLFVCETQAVDINPLPGVS